MQEYNKTDQHLHWLSQTIAKANRTYVTSKPDDSHTNLYYDVLDNRIVGRWINNGKENIMLTLNLKTLDFEWLNAHKKIVQTITSVGKTSPEIEHEIDAGLGDLHLLPQGFTDDLHFQIPDYPFAAKPVEAISVVNMHQWKTYRKLANVLCGIVLGYLELEGEIRIWPHHFDTGIYVVVEGKMGLGFGLAMEDEMAGAPYFYLSGYPVHGTLEFNDLPKLATGRWEVGEHWQGAILPLSKLLNGIFEENRQEISKFLKRSIKWYLRQR